MTAGALWRDGRFVQLPELEPAVLEEAWRRAGPARAARARGPPPRAARGPRVGARKRARAQARAAPQCSRFLRFLTKSRNT